MSLLGTLKTIFFLGWDEAGRFDSSNALILSCYPVPSRPPFLPRGVNLLSHDATLIFFGLESASFYK